MDRVWQWAWDRHGPRYSWAVYALSYMVILPIWVAPPLLIVEFEQSDRHFVATAIAAAAAMAALFTYERPGFKVWRPMERWAAGDPIDRHEAIESTYTYARNTLVRTVVACALAGGIMCISVGAISGASASRMIQYAIYGATALTSVQLVSIHPYVEAFMRPVRVAIAADTGTGDMLPRSRPSFASWSNMSILATAWAFSSRARSWPP